MSADVTRESEAIHSLTDVLIRALREAGKTGQPDTASRLAAQAWLALKKDWPREAERVHGVMHFLARLPEPIEIPDHVSQLKEKS